MISGPLEDQWAVVTGGSKGMGLAIASRFVDAAANVVIVARGEDDLASACELLRSQGRPGQQIFFVKADVSNPDSIESLFDVLKSDVPEINILVANAGGGLQTPFLDITPQDWDFHIALNLTGPFLICQRAAKMMVNQRGETKAILMVSSIRAFGVRPGRLAYSVAKAGLNQFVRMSAYEFTPYGIRVNAISPGITATARALRSPETFEEARLSVPLGRAGSPRTWPQRQCFCAVQSRDSRPALTSRWMVVSRFGEFRHSYFSQVA